MQTDNNDITATNAPTDNVQSIDEQLGNIIKKVAEKIKSCENILVALSRDPSVDEISAAIGLTMVLDKIGKHVTAIYSGVTPNALEFLKPNETFEKDTNSLQDFIIALNKDKADHLRYKIEGDYVKVYITPYKTTLSQNDLEFSQGDYNVDLVISIDVSSAEELDGALREYGRIMHDATAINITTNQTGRFAELEWSDPSMSSVCEMVVKLCEELGYDEFDQPTATALLTGIVSSTERFSNARTTSDTMQISSRLMQAGADQQLISNNIMTAAPAPTPEPVVAPAQPIPELAQPISEPAAPIPAPTLTPEPTPALNPIVEPQAPITIEPIINRTPTNPAIQAAPSVPAQAFEYSTIPDMQFTPAPAPTPEPIQPVAPTIEPQTPIEPMQPIYSQPTPAPEPTPTPKMVPEVPATPEVAPAPVEVPNTNINIELPPPPAPDISNITMPPIVAEAPEPVTPEPVAPAPEPTPTPAPSPAPIQPVAPIPEPASQQPAQPAQPTPSSQPPLQPQDSSAFKIPGF